MATQHEALVTSITLRIVAVHFSHWTHCVRCALCAVRCLCDAWGLRGVMVMLWVKEADRGIRAFAAGSAPCLSQWYTTSVPTCRAQCTAYATPLSEQHRASAPSISGLLRLFRPTGGGGGGGGKSVRCEAEGAGD